METVYRDNPDSTESPTINHVAIDASDEADEAGTEDYAVSIRHCRGFPERKGFMPSVQLRCSPGSQVNGELHLGLGEDAYQAAVTEGRKLAAEKQAEMDKMLAKHFASDPT